MPPVEKLRWWYLSFVDPHKGWLGACCVEGDSIQDASDAAWKATCNPGGQVLGLALQPDDPVPEALMYKLVTDDAMLQILLGEIMAVEVDDSECEECKKKGMDHAN
jgi:hypothetical protein